jgi:hypothetical protein
LELRLGGRWSFGAEYLMTRLDDRDEFTVRVQGPAPATNPFVLTNPSGTDLRRADQFDLHALRFMTGYRFECCDVGLVARPPTTPARPFGSVGEPETARPMTAG